MNDQDRSLSAALADLADTMPDDPFRVDAVHARIDRNRRRRRVGHGVVGATVVGLTVVGVGVLRPTPPSVSTVPATQPNAAPAAGPALPACAAVPSPRAPADGDPAASGQDAAASAKGAAAAAAAGEPSAGWGTGTRGVKGFGTVVATTDASITIALSAPGPGQPAEVTAAFTGESLFYDGEAVMSSRPAPNPGDQVGFAVAEAAGGNYDLLLLQVHPLLDASLGHGDGQATESAKAAGAIGDTTPGATKYVAEVVSAQPGSLTLKLRGGPLAGQTVTATLAPEVMYFAGNQQCVDPVFAPGGMVAVLLEQGAGGSYTIARVALFAP